jgi:PAS domain S-box-containing protein
LQGEQASADDIEADLIDRRVPLEIWASPVLDNAGNVESAVVAFQDISTRKQSELALQASEKKFRVIVENTFDGIVFMARDREVLYVSPSYARLNGMNVEDMTGKSGVGFVHSDDRERVAGVFYELIQQSGNRVSVEYRSRHQDGSWFWVETNAVNLLDDPHVQAVVLNIRDITGRKQAEAELTAYRKQLELLVEERTQALSDSNEQLIHEIRQREKLEQLLYQHIHWLTALHKVRQAIDGEINLPRAYAQLTDTIRQSQEAMSVFLIYWADQDESIYYPQQNDSTLDLERMAPIFETETPLRQELELGKPITYSKVQMASLPAPLGDLFQEDGCQSLVLMPMSDRHSITGVFGAAFSRPVEALSLAEIELLVTMTSDLSELAQDAQRVAQARALVAVEERNRLARDLHDSVTQVLFAASLVAEVLPQIWRRDPKIALESVEELRRLSRGAMAEMRAMLLELRPTAVLKTPLPELLTQLTEAITSRVELSFKLFVEQTPTLPEDVHTGYYRIAQEALNNVVKHAQANQVIVRLNSTRIASDETGKSGYEVQMVIEDDGVGFSAADKGQEHLGLGIMRERAGAIQAILSINSLPGAGTEVLLAWRGELEDSS